MTPNIHKDTNKNINKHTYKNNSPQKLSLAAVLCACMFMPTAFAQNSSAPSSSYNSNNENYSGQSNPGYLTDASGRAVKNSYNECWRSGSLQPGTQHHTDCVAPVRTIPPEAPPDADPVPKPYVQPPVRDNEPMAQQPWVQTVYFHFDSAQITREGRETLRLIAQQIRSGQVPRDIRIEILGHTDPVGSDNYNLRLSSERAHTVRRALQNLGVRNTLDVIPMGEGKIVVSCEKGVNYANTRERNECNAPNRRVEIVIDSPRVRPQ